MNANTESYDVVVVGSGGGLIGAYAAASRGLRTLVIEKTGLVGGTTSYSGAGLWFPGSAPVARAGIDPSDLEKAREYLRSIVDDESREDLQDAYLATAGPLIDELEANPLFATFVHGPVPDYYASAPGATPHGRTVFPMPIGVDELGDKVSLLRTSLPSERWGEDEGATLGGGRALIGRALLALLATGNADLRIDTAMTGLVVEDGRVVGIEATSDGQPVIFRASRGVILAAGGFERNPELRVKYGAIPQAAEWSNGAPGNTGDALKAGIAVGADTEMLEEAWFIPGLVQPDGLPVFHTGTRGGIFVNGAGERFLNETQPYDQTGHAMQHAHATTGVSHVPTHWIIDQKQLDRDSFGGDPSKPVAPEWFSSGALKKADTLEELAEIIGVPFEALSQSVKEYNGYAETGVDEKFHRGETTWDQMFTHVVGFAARPEQNYMNPIETELPNPLLIPIDTAPYYAATILLSDIGTKGGLKTDTRARVLRPDGSHIDGLYASGNTMAAMSGQVYPGAGTPIGSSLVFSYLAALDIAGETTPTT